MIRELIEKTRSCRRFYQDQAVSLQTLKQLVDLARLSASAANLQPLRYILSNEPDKNERIFSCTAWAGYLQNWSGPEEGERPPAYIIILADREVSKKVDCDHGIAAQSIVLGAKELGYSACMITALKREALRDALKIPERYDILMVIALGKCRETVVLEKAGADGNIQYWRDARKVHHVPKRALEDIILSEY